MHKLVLSKQSKGFCGATSLRIVLSRYGINKSEKYLATLSKCNRLNGCEDYNIVSAAKTLGFYSYIKRGSTIKEINELIKEGKSVIVNWFSPDAGDHYSVVMGFQGKKIVLADPQFGKIVRHDIKWFEDRWFNSPFFENIPVLKEMIVIDK